MSSELIFYNSPEGKKKIEAIFQDESFWLTQKVIANLFGAKPSVFTKHLSNIFISNELDEKTVIVKMAHTAKDGKTYKTKHPVTMKMEVKSKTRRGFIVVCKLLRDLLNLQKIYNRIFMSLSYGKDEI